MTKLHQRINCTAHIIGIFHVSFAKTTAELSLPLIVFRIFLYFSNFSNYLFCLVYLIFFYSYLLSSSTCFSFFVSPFLFLEFFLFFYLFKLFILSRLFILVLLIFFSFFLYLLFILVFLFLLLSVSSLVSLFTKPFHLSQHCQQHKHMTYSYYTDRPLHHMITAFSSVCT